MKTDLTFLKPLVAGVLQDDRREWTVQGFGFLRTYFGSAANPKRFRLNLWDHRFSVPNVSTIHDHPWDLRSIIIAGPFKNQRLEMADVRRGPLPTFGPTHTFATIKTGVASNLQLDDLGYCKLLPRPMEHYSPGDEYSQSAREIHETIFEDGCVTLNERIGDTEQARVFWPFGTDWVDAKPRAATRDEVSDAVLRSLREWF